jgi:hypothetical protein
MTQPIHRLIMTIITRGQIIETSEVVAKKSNLHSKNNTTVNPAAVYTHSCSDHHQFSGVLQTADHACSNNGVSTSQFAIRSRRDVGSGVASLKEGEEMAACVASQSS